jgi:GNAT superfamily N-acetyltransferase
MRPLWILNDLFVVPKARRFGVAKALMQRARDWAKENKADSLWLETAIDNVPAQSLYERLGWKRDNEFYRYNLLV